jgi:serine/threonine protein kinase/tetratricopeptide (TPR) repeat protein
MIGRTLAHYRIVSAIGAGGMGEVYRAIDSKLGRTVALKVLPALMAEDPERLARFEQEARAVAALNHPHIVTLYSVEQADGINFLTMELVEGDSLAAAIPEKGLPLDRILGLGTALAEALAAAHDKGIVHRDLKPANVMVTLDGRVKVLDFGLAKDLRPALASEATMTAAGQTQVGVVMGTPAYMSPEQLGGRIVDHRTDIFSLGIMLYQMASGRRPFSGSSSVELASAILRDAPRPLAETRPELPAALGQLVQRCLEKDRDRRTQTARDVIAALASIAQHPSSSGTRSLAPSIAVLPFANMSADKDQEYFSDGLAEEIIHLLAQIPNLKVIARTSAFAFRGRNEDVRRIAQALDVTHVLEGSVRRAGNRIRVSTQLVAASDGAHIWSERYDGDLGDIFAMQDEISAAVSRALRVKLSGDVQARYQPKLPAYEAYLQARHHSAKVTPESMEMSRQCLEAAIALDPDFALAHVGMAFYWVALTIFGGCPPSLAVPAAREANARALNCDPSLPEAHALLGFLAACFDYDYIAAARHFEAPLTRLVGFSIVRSAYAAFQFFRGNVDDAIAITERTIAEDPLEVWPRMNLHAFLQAAGRDREAYDEAMKALDFDGNQVVARVSVAHFHAYWGQLDLAVAAARRAVEVGPWYPDAIATLAATLRRNGEEQEAEMLYRSLGVGARYGDARAQAVYHLISGEVDTAADWVEKAIEERDHSMQYYLRFVIGRRLRVSPRWSKIAQMSNFPADTPRQQP